MFPLVLVHEKLFEGVMTWIEMCSICSILSQNIWTNVSMKTIELVNRNSGKKPYRQSDNIILFKVNA